MQQVVSIPGDYFIKSVKTFYHNYMRALFRELIQNSVDAGAQNIRFSLDDTSYTCEDDGAGMTRERMQEALLTMGGSFKLGDSVGGFGEAKILLLFSMEKYIIHSQTTKAVGSGLTYSLKDMPYRIGTLVSGVFHADFEANRSVLQDILKAYVQDCRVAPRIYLNGSVLYQDRQARPVTNLEGCGKLFEKNSPQKCYDVYVRQNGVLMFTRTLCKGVPKKYILELDNSIDVLSSNRDGFRSYKHSSMVDDLINELNVEKRVKSSTPMIKRYFGREGNLETNIPVPILASQEVVCTESRSSVSSVTPVVPSTRNSVVVLDHSKALLTNNFLVYPDKTKSKVLKKYIPGGMTKRNEFLALLWKNLLLGCMSITGIQETFSIGFTLNKQAEASRTIVGDEIYYLLNPELFKEKTKDDIYFKMLTLVIHELAHHFEKYHDIDFVIAQDKLMVEVLKSRINRNQLIKSAKQDNL